MKKYTTREAIIKDIDAAQNKVKKALAKAQEHLDDEELLKGSSNVADLRKAREAADKQFRKIKRLQTVRLPALKEKLAEFDTISLLPADTAPEKCPAPAPPVQPEPVVASDDVTP